MEIRKMTDRDLDKVADMYLAAYDADWNKNGARTYIEKFFRFEPERCLVMVAPDERLACAVLGYSFERETGVVLFIQELMVHPDFRNRGLGKTLVTKLRETLTTTPSHVDIKPLVKADTTVLNFYNSLGFDRDKAVSFSFDED